MFSITQWIDFLIDGFISLVMIRCSGLFVKAILPFVTGTFAGVIPVVEIDEHGISGGIRGELTKRLQNIYKKDIDTLYPPSD